MLSSCNAEIFFIEGIVIIVHIFQEEIRRYYNLDELWSAAPEVEIPAEYRWEDREP